MKSIDKRNGRLDISKAPLPLQLIFYCLRTASGQNCEDRIRKLSGQIKDWNEFVRRVVQHRVISPVHKGLTQLEHDNLPTAILTDLKNRSRLSAQSALAKSAELVQLVKEFKKNGISVLPFKGPVVGLLAYGDVGSRHVGDLDIMVAPGQVLEAEKLLLGKGFQRINPHLEMTSRQQSFYLRNNHHFRYIHPETGIFVELHWRFGANRYIFPLTFNALWEGRQVIDLGGIPMSTLNPEHTMLLLCTHGALHAWSRLFWLNDIAQMVTQGDSINWSRLTIHSEQLGTTRMVIEGIFLANLLLGCHMPDPVKVHMPEHRKTLKLAGRFLPMRRLIDNSLHKSPTRLYWFAEIRRPILRNDLRYKLEVFLGRLRPRHMDWERFPLPDRFFIIYYMIRPIMWFLRWYVPESRTYQEGPLGQHRKFAFEKRTGKS